MYCGDETGSYIGQIGSHSCRFGYGGEDNPKVVVPPYAARNRDGKESPSSTPWHVPTSCLSSRVATQEVKSIMDMAHSYSSWNSNDDDDTNTDDGMKSDSTLPYSSSPICNPDRFLSQGQIVQDWEAMETAWNYSMTTLRAFDSTKHTKGGNGDAAAAADGKCIHPVLAVTPGFSDLLVDDANGSSTTGKQYQESLRRRQQTQYTELLLEKLQAPAVFLASGPMLSAFSFGRQTALVVDIGAGGCRVTPVVDGLVLRTSQRRSGRGGHWLDHCLWKAALLQNESQNNKPADSALISPRYQSSSSSSALFAKSPTYHAWAMQSLMSELRSSPNILKLTGWNQIQDSSDVPFAGLESNSGKSDVVPSAAQAIAKESKDSEQSKKNDSDADGDDVSMKDADESAPKENEAGSVVSSASDAVYELPDGTKIHLEQSLIGKDMCRVHELLFTDDVPFNGQNGKGDSSQGSRSDTSAPSSSSGTISNLPLHKLIRESLLAVSDVDSRKDLASNIVLVGGTSAMLITQLEQRLSWELTNLLPNFVKPKVIASKFSIERSASSWIGGSILTSLGSFQQLWLSKAEYEEYGAALAIQRFPDW